MTQLMKLYEKGCGWKTWLYVHSGYYRPANGHTCLVSTWVHLTFDVLWTTTLGSLSDSTAILKDGHISAGNLPNLTGSRYNIRFPCGCFLLPLPKLYDSIAFLKQVAQQLLVGTVRVESTDKAAGSSKSLW